MAEDILARIRRIATGLGEYKQIEPVARGDNYYAFDLTDANGTKSSLPPLWIDPATSDHQIERKLRLELTQSLHPEAEPGDLSIPNIQTEGDQP